MSQNSYLSLFLAFIRCFYKYTWFSKKIYDDKRVRGLVKFYKKKYSVVVLNQ